MEEEGIAGQGSGAGKVFYSGTSLTAGGELKDETWQAVLHQARRTVMVAQWVKQGLNNIKSIESTS